MAAAAAAPAKTPMTHIDPPGTLGGNVAANQRFRYIASGHIVGYDGRCLDVKDGSSKEGASLIYYDKAAQNSPNQTWDYKDGYFVTRMGTGFCIDVSGGHANVRDGGELILWTPGGGKAQQWDIDKNGFIRSRADPRFCIDVNGGAFAVKGLSKVSMWTAAV